jgi:hypothetical protein
MIRTNNTKSPELLKNKNNEKSREQPCEDSTRLTDIQCVRSVAVHLQKVLELMPTSIYTVKTELNNYTLYRYCTSTAV